MDRESGDLFQGTSRRKMSEKDGEIEYEDWIYGREPPQDPMDFYSSVGDPVIRVGAMGVSGEKGRRTEKES